MLEKMTTIKEAKKAVPHDVLLPFVPSDGQRLPPSYVPPPNRAVFKRKRWFHSRGRAMAAWFATQGPSLSGPCHQGDPHPRVWRCSTPSGKGQPRAPSSCFAIGSHASRRTRQSTFSGGAEMSCRAALVGVPNLAISTCCCIHHKSDSSARNFHDCSSPALRTQSRWSFTMLSGHRLTSDLTHHQRSKMLLSLSESGWGPPISRWDKVNPLVGGTE
jgi:hypothetical protein